MSRSNAHSSMIGLALAVMLSPATTLATQNLYGQRLTAPDASVVGFGNQAPAVSGDWIAVFGRLSAAAGDGRVYLFHRQSGAWSFAQEIAPPDGAGSQDSLAMANGLLFVGSPNAYNSALQANAGVVSVYALQNGWVLQQTLNGNTAFQSGETGFGTSLAIDRQTLYIGFPGYMTSTGDQIGDVEAYDISTSMPSYIGQILPTSPQLDMAFGSSLAAAGGMLAVGADNEGVPGVGVSAGALHTFVRSANAWIEQSVLNATYPYSGDHFPNAIVIDNTHVIAADVNCNSQGKEGPWGQVFSYAGATTGISAQTGTISPNPSSIYGYNLFGKGITSVNGMLLVAAPNTGNAGQVFAYHNDNGAAWSPVSTFVAQQLQTADAFGVSMATDGKTLVVGASESGRSPPSGGAIYAFAYPPTDRIFADGM
ncbi:MAG: FG-GAP repeat protein [Xanthomonadaceae bacterium]|nr:FG-GAP repeat protein [Xanthomonadaceae bacterium]MDE1961431.1 hypothetical protein [Xanthomonadaceae bacterium]